MSDYLQQSCNRCGSKRAIARTWKEKIETFSGTSEIEISEIVCVNADCQAAFQKELEEQSVRRDEMLKKKEEQTLLRKANAQKTIADRKQAKLKVVLKNN